jgi:dephospho-CoA kinase
MPPDNGSRPAMIGLTGAIAAGKSAALEALANLGAATISSDAVVHQLLDHPPVVSRLVERWGEDVAPGGTVDRSRIGAQVFGDRDELNWLESLLHPLVGGWIARWTQELPDSTEVAVVEVPLLFETEMEHSFDATLVISAPDAVREARAAARGTDLVGERHGRQLPPREKEARATYVVRNEGTPEELESALAALLPELASLAP